MKRAILITSLALMGPFGGTALAAGSHSPAHHRPAAPAIARHVPLAFPGSAQRLTKLAGKPSAQPPRLAGRGTFRTQLNDMDWQWDEWGYAGKPGYWWAVYYDGPNDNAYDFGFQLFYYNGTLYKQPTAFVYYGSFGLWSTNMSYLWQ